MSRTRRSAKQAGSRFERHIADHLATHVDDRIDRRVKAGSKDRGDIAGLRYRGERIVIECKNTTRANLAGWITEAHTAAGNDDALIGIIAHKRHGVAVPGRQWVTMTLDNFIALITGTRDHITTDDE